MILLLMKINRGFYTNFLACSCIGLYQKYRVSYSCIYHTLVSQEPKKFTFHYIIGTWEWWPMFMCSEGSLRECSLYQDPFNRGLFHIQNVSIWRIKSVTTLCFSHSVKETHSDLYLNPGCWSKSCKKKRKETKNLETIFKFIINYVISVWYNIS